jgi:spermidine/putrescine-binding protein
MRHDRRSLTRLFAPAGRPHPRLPSRFLPALLVGVFILTACGSETPTATPGTGGATTPTATAQEPTTLNIFEWGIYCPDETREAFETANNVTVNCSFYQGNEELRARLQADHDFSVVAPSSNFIANFVERGLLQPLDLSKIANYADLLPSYTQGPWGTIDGQTYAVPYASGISGICYRTDKISEPVTSWAALLDERYTDHIAMTGSSGDTAFISFALYLGIDIATLHETLDTSLPQLIDVIEQQNALNPLFYTSAEQQKNYLATGDAWISTTDHGLCSTLRLEDVPVQFVVPEEGGWAWIDAWAIPADAPAPNLAHAWINHAISPESSATLMKKEGLFVVNPKAVELLPPDLAEAMAIPTDATIHEWPSYPEEAVQEMVSAYLEARG